MLKTILMNIFGRFKNDIIVVFMVELKMKYRGIKKSFGHMPKKFYSTMNPRIVKVSINGWEKLVSSTIETQTDHKKILKVHDDCMFDSLSSSVTFIKRKTN